MKTPTKAIRKALLPILILTLAAAGLSAAAVSGGRSVLKGTAKTVRAQPRESFGDINFRIFFKMKAENLKSSGSFVVLEGSQGNYVFGGDKPFEVKNSQGVGIEFKKFGTIINCLPVRVPGRKGWVRLQCQFELSGPGEPVTSLKVPSIVSFQIQTTFEIREGRKLLIVDEKDKSIEVRIVRVKG